MTSEVELTKRQLAEELEVAKTRLAAQQRELECLRALVRIDGRALGEILQATGFRTLEDLRRCTDLGYELAYFVLGESWRAVDAIQNALKELAEEHRRQARRRSYRRFSSRPRKAFLDPHQSFQALVLAATTPHEQEQETGRGLAQEDLVLRLVKHLLEITLTAGSWQLNLAVSCLLRGAQLKEAWKVQKLLDQHPDPQAGFRSYVSDPLRRRMMEDKARIEKLLAGRFRELAGKPARSAFRWRRLGATEIERLGAVLDRTFDRLHIWESPHHEEVLPVEEGPSKNIPGLRAMGSGPEEIARVELARKAVLMSPEGYSRLVARLDLSFLDSRWFMPQLLGSPDEQPPDPPSPDLPVLGGGVPGGGLSDEHFESILVRLAGDMRALRESQSPTHGSGRWLPRWPRWMPRIELRSWPVTAGVTALLLTGSLLLLRLAPAPVAGIAFRSLEHGTAVERSVGAEQSLRVPRHAASLVLVVPVENALSDAEVRLELVYPSGETWRAGRVSPIDGELTLALPTSGLPEGLYQLRFFNAGDPPDDVEEVAFRVSFDD